MYARSRRFLSSTLRRERIVSVAISLTNPSFSIVNEMLGLSVDRLAAAQVRGSPLRAVMANNLSADLVYPAGPVWMWDCMYTITSTHTHYLQSYEHPLVLPQLMHR